MGEPLFLWVNCLLQQDALGWGRSSSERRGSVWTGKARDCHNERHTGMREVCLCAQCVRDYQTAGYRLKRNDAVRTQEPCEKCDRLGWTFWAEQETGRGGAKHID